MDAEKRRLLPPAAALPVTEGRRRAEKKSVWSGCLRVLLIKGRGGGEADEEWAGRLSS